MKKTIVFLLLLAIIGGGAALYWRSTADTGLRFRTAPVNIGDLVVTISATGTAEPVEVIDVGAQVAGRILTFGKDEKTGQPIDFGSTIEQGTVLARIDETLYSADLQAQQAQVDQATANRDRTKAELEQSRAQFRQAEREWKRAQEIMSTNASALAAVDFDNYRAKYEIAQAAIGVAQAGVAQSDKAVALTKANLVRAQTNLGYCTIKSPVNGVIIDRRVNIGQTVVASLSAPSLFLIAKDLRNMQVWVAVNEADIGRIHPGQPVNFTVDAYPGQAFRGTVNKIRLNASMTQNVVTYTVEVNTDNSDGRLLPYLSATINFEVAKHEDVLTVPNTALNWNPPAELGIASAKPPTEPRPTSTDNRNQDENRPRRNGRGKKDRQQAQSPKPTSQPVEPQTGTVWVLEDESIRPITVTIGGSDGVNTQVTGPDIRKDMAVVIGQEIIATGSDGTVNPFAPKFFSHGSKSKGSKGGSGR